MPSYCHILVIHLLRLHSSLVLLLFSHSCLLLRLLPIDHEEGESREAAEVGVELDVGVVDAFVADGDELLAVLVVGVDGHGDLVEDVEERHDFVALVGRGIAEEDLEGGADAVGLHLAEEAALLALHAVEDAGDVVDVLLVLLDLGVVLREEAQALLLLLAQVVPIKLPQQFRKQLAGVQVGSDVVGLDGEVAAQVTRSFLYRLRQDAVEEEEVFDALRMVQHSALVLGVVEVELRVSLGAQICPYALVGGVLVEAGEVGGDAGVQSADEVVEDLFVAAELVVVAAEAVLAVDEVPDGGAVVVGEALDVAVDVEVLPLVVGLVLHVPHPPFLLSPLGAPQILALRVRAHAVGVAPGLRDVALIAAADGAAVGPADAVEDAQRALLVDVEPDHPEVLGLDQLLQHRRCRLVHLLHRVLLETRPVHQQVETQHVRRHEQDSPNSHSRFQITKPKEDYPPQAKLL